MKKLRVQYYDLPVHGYNHVADPPPSNREDWTAFLVGMIAELAANPWIANVHISDRGSRAQLVAVGEVDE